MPHATEDETLDDAEHMRNVTSFVNGYQDADYERVIDQRDKADDAIDYEDVSDDDLPEEEQGTNDFDGDDDDPFERMFGNGASGIPGLPPDAAQPRTNGYRSDHELKQPPAGDLFEDIDETNDLFGDNTSSPELQRAQPVSRDGVHAPQRPGLALPSKSSLALPGMHSGTRSVQAQQMNQSPESMSPPSFAEGDYSPEGSDEDDLDDESGLDYAERMQRRMFNYSKRKQRGEDVDDLDEDINMDVFYSLYPGFEKNQNPDFIKLFPPRPGKYRGKVPLKPPRALATNKLSLELLADQEKAFRTSALTNKIDENFSRPGVVSLQTYSRQEDSDDDLALSVMDDNERIGGVSMQDLAIICGDWDIPSSDASSDVGVDVLGDDWDAMEAARPRKRQRALEDNLSLALQDPHISFENPERATAKLAKSVALDLNDEYLLVDEVSSSKKRRAVREPKRITANTKGVAKRYNISNDEAYDLLKENHQHKVRSTLGAMAIEHSLPAVKLQFPFYRVNLDGKAKRAFHRPTLDVRDAKVREHRFQKPKYVKRKHLKGKETKEIFAQAEDLSLGDNSNLLLLEYSEEAPVALSNFGMGNKLFNYYRKRDADDQERPKREIGETNVLLTQDKSPFANFGHVDRGEIVPTLHNGMYRAPVFQHKAKPTDFVIGISSTYASGHRFFLRNAENLHIVGQQLPTMEVPARHSRRVTDAAKKRLKALSYRMYSKSIDPIRRGKPLNNDNLLPHLPGHDMPQTRSKMREFMAYEKSNKDHPGVWVPKGGEVVPDTETIRSYIKPEDICLLDSMQAGVQHLQDLGIAIDDKNEEEDKELGDDEDIEKQLAPWRATKNFLAACQGKAMLKLYGDGDPTGRGEGFSFVKTSMKGGFKAFGESAEDKIAAKKRRETGGHSYNVAEQQRLYDDSIRGIWNRQKDSLTAEVEHSDTEMEDYHDEPGSAYPSSRAMTPRSSFATPARHNDDSASQFSRGSAGRRDDVLIITRRIVDSSGEPRIMQEEVTNQKVISLYRKKQLEKKLHDLRCVQVFNVDSVVVLM